MDLVNLLMICGMVGGISARPFAKHYLDMTHQFNNKTIYWPTGQKESFDLAMITKILPNTDIMYAEGDISAGEHGGTHMDSPYHFNLDGLKIGQIPLDRLKAPAAVIDIRRQVAKDPEYMATQDDYNEWELAHGELPEDAIVLFCTGWDKHWPDWNKVFGTTDFHNYESMHFPGVDPQLVKWLVENRKYVGVGIDTPTPDGSKTILSLEVHLTLAGENLFILENVKGVCDIPQHGATLIMLPQKIEHGSGAPTRVVATWGEDAYHMADDAQGSHLAELGVILLALFTSTMF